MLGLKHSVRALNAASRVVSARALSGSAVRQNTVSMKQPLQSSSAVTDDNAIYQKFVVPDSDKYKQLQERQLYYTEKILQDSWTLTDSKNESLFVYFRYAVVALGVITYLFTHYRITRGKKKREGQVI